MKIEIYQVNTDRDEDGVCFCSMEELEDRQGTDRIHSAIYDKVYEGDVDCYTLDGVFRMFNVEKPPCFKGHSLSVSDVIHVVEDGPVDEGFYFCDTDEFWEIIFHPEETMDRVPNSMKVVFVAPEKEPKIIEVGTELEDMQGILDGMIEACPLAEEDIYLVCNEEGKINGMQPNRALYDGDGELCDVVFGPFFICDGKGSSFASLTEEQLTKYMDRFRCPERFFVRDGNVLVIPMTPEKEKEEVVR